MDGPATTPWVSESSTPPPGVFVGDGVLLLSLFPALLLLLLLLPLVLPGVDAEFSISTQSAGEMLFSFNLTFVLL